MIDFPDVFRTLPKEVEDGFHFYKFDPSLCDVFFTEVLENTCIDTHSHSVNVINLITSGDFFIKIDGVEKKFSPGEWVVISKNVLHSVRTQELVRLIEFWFKS